MPHEQVTDQPNSFPGDELPETMSNSNNDDVIPNGRYAKVLLSEQNRTYLGASHSVIVYVLNKLKVWNDDQPHSQHR